MTQILYPLVLTAVVERNAQSSLRRHYLPTLPNGCMMKDARKVLSDIRIPISFDDMLTTAGSPLRKSFNNYRPCRLATPSLSFHSARYNKDKQIETYFILRGGTQA